MYIHVSFPLAASKNVSDWWLAYWISHSHSHPGTLLNTTSSTFFVTHSQLSTPLLGAYSPTDDVPLVLESSGNSSTPVVLKEASDNLKFYLGIYGGLAAANSVRSSIMYM